MPIGGSEYKELMELKPSFVSEERWRAAILFAFLSRSHNRGSPTIRFLEDYYTSEQLNEIYDRVYDLAIKINIISDGWSDDDR